MAIARPSVASLFIEMKFRDQVLATGTAFVAKDQHGSLLFTNRHNVTGRHQDTGACLSATGGVPDRIVIYHNRAGALGQWFPVEEFLFDNETPRWLEHPTLGPRADLIGLPMQNLDGVELVQYDLGTASAAILVGISDPVSVIGFPFGLRVAGSLAVWATGFVASELDVDHDALPMFLIDCRSRRGQSGSPVVAYRSGGAVAMADGSSAVFSGPVEKLMGIYSGRVNEESDLGRVWKTSAIAAVLRRLAPNPFDMKSLNINLSL